MTESDTTSSDIGVGLHYPSTSLTDPRPSSCCHHCDHPTSYFHRSLAPACSSSIGDSYATEMRSAICLLSPPIERYRH
ncbi:hypothetical protein BJ165DRAFT_1515601 [Panaeolus papilionaceus]|nr:hypothetical protein BJ165DRAFT_1515601 [Panaeolus papilionaceus]